MFGEIISTYTRAQAIDDGMLIDVSKMAKEAGFKLPVAISAGLHEVISNPPPSQSHQDYEGRLWDVLFMGAMACRRHPRTREVTYRLILHYKRKKLMTLRVVLSAEDPEGGWCITIMLENES